MPPAWLSSIPPFLRQRGWQLAAVAWMGLALETGCGLAKPAGSVGAAPVVLVDQPAKRLTFDWHGSFYREGGQAGSWIQRRIEQQYNVVFSPTFLPAFSYDRLLTFRLIGGDIPDVYWIRDARQLQRAVMHGFVLELPYETIVRHAPDYVRLLRRVAPDGWLLSHCDGRNFGLPNFNLRQAVYPHTGIWNLTWLRRVGIEKVPETLEEMEHALRLFHEQDPDGDGRRDTYGYCPWKPGASGGFGGAGTLDRSFEDIFGAFGVAQNAWLLREGRVVWGGVLPGALEALEVLRRWYAGGLIHPDYMTLPMGNLEVRKQLFSGTVGYIMGHTLGSWGAFDRRISTSIATLHAAVNPGEELAPAWFPIGPRGDRGVRSWEGSIGGIMVFGPHLVESPEKIARVLRLFNDAARDPELHREFVIGKRGLHWEWDDAVGIRKLPPYDNKAVGARELLGEGATIDIGDNHGYFVPFCSSPEEFQRFSTEDARAFRDTFMKPEWGIRDVLLMNDTIPSSAKYLPHVVELQAITFTGIITGKLPLDAFESFVRRWHDEGGELLTREANDLYHRKQQIRQRVDDLLAQASGREDAGP